MASRRGMLVLQPRLETHTRAGWNVHPNSAAENRVLKTVLLEIPDNKHGGEMNTNIKLRRPSVRTFAQRAGGVTLTVMAVLFVLVLVLVGILGFMSPGTPKPFLDKNGNLLAGSISQKVFVNIGVLKQGMFIKSKDKTNPVLLYLHGGLPDYFLTAKYPTGLEDYFTVVWWEQRGSGLSYSTNIPPETKTLEQMISDTLEMTNYLRRRFGKEKIFLMGHSGGTFIGVQAAARAPALYHAYIGVAQMSNQLESEKLAYDFMLEQFKENKNTNMVRKLKAAPVTMTDGTPKAYLAVRDQAMHSLGIGTTHDMKSVVTGIFLPSLTCREYTLLEKINLWRGKARTGVSPLWNEITTTDLSKQLPALEIPVYFFHGIYDYTCSYTVAKSYFEKLKAPLKGFYTFKHSAHSPLFEEPGKMLEIVRADVLTGSKGLADPQ
jgi:pimeloyl-ACP methyl ester carboxylesterase